MTDIAKVKRLADRLIGTPNLGTTLSDQIDALSLAESKVLDALAFKCEQCEWWFAARERKIVKDKGLCEECARE